MKLSTKTGKVRLFFEDEASFGRVSPPRYCWCALGKRPIVPQQRIREYRDVFGAVEPKTGESFFMFEPPKKTCTTDSHNLKPKEEEGRKSKVFNTFLQGLSSKYPNDVIVLVCDNAWWHKSQYVKLPHNIVSAFIPPYTPEMNPIEQVWREVRTILGNVFFDSLSDMETSLSAILTSLPPEVVRSITQRDWFMKSEYLAEE